MSANKTSPGADPIPIMTQIYGSIGFTRWRRSRFRLRRAYEPPDETLKGRRPLYISVVVLVALSLILRQPLLFIAALLVLALTVIPELWYRFGLRSLTVERTLSATHVAFGDSVEVTLTVENRKALPLPWLEVADEYPDGLPLIGRRLAPSSRVGRALLRSTLALWAYQRVRRRVRLQTVARGVYQFGPTLLRTGDPFGILTREVSRESPTSLFVRPIVAPITRFGLPPFAPFGERAASRRLLEDPLRVKGVRDYVPGDEPRRIHWKATARMGALQSKVYEPSIRHTLVIFLDVRTFPRQINGYDEALTELAITAAASVAQWAQQQGYAVGIYSNGTMSAADSGLETMRLRLEFSSTGAVWSDDNRALAAELRHESQRLRIQPSARTEQVGIILDGLARLLPYYGMPMEDLIASERFRLPPGATVVYLGSEAALDARVLLALRQVRVAGHLTSLLLTQSDIPAAQGDGAMYAAGLQAHLIGGRERWDELVMDVLGPELASLRAKTTLATPLRSTSQRDRNDSGGVGAQPSAGAMQNGRANDGTGDPTPPASRKGNPRALVIE